GRPGARRRRRRTGGADGDLCAGRPRLAPAQGLRRLRGGRESRPVELAPGIAAALAEQDGDPVYVLPDDPELACPTVGDVAAAIDAKLLGAAGEVLERDVRAVVVAAMSVEH